MPAPRLATGESSVAFPNTVAPLAKSVPQPVVYQPPDRLALRTGLAEAGYSMPLRSARNAQQLLAFEKGRVLR